ncbi:response regulator [Arundinibacter roseus]|uniref:Response regulator n=1 Tax=Arundinibacter roseus TaxID=2070510 RepID=A0A4R4KC31_9BACT|nr:response regulator [Arundinibacter roseus]TDB65193.1 response regulator [Arundinibacter roseus]
MRIVIIEDEIELGHLIQNFLRKKIPGKDPNQIKIATNIRDGLHFIEEMHPDWIFLDNNLPDGKGINIIENIKQFGTSRVIMMSAMSNLKEEALKRGVDYFMDKPISFVEIQKILNENNGFTPSLS